MKITDSETIKSAERELLDGIVADLDWKTIEDIFRKNHNLEIQGEVKYKRGDILVRNHEIAYELDFDVKVSVSILMDRNGNFLSVENRGAHEEGQKSQGQGAREEMNGGYEEALTALGSEA
ncbi:MAG: hypothetical protein P8175_19990 [Deltaproteobacteria bacterium]